jgi:type III pantothenate kinase
MRLLVDHGNTRIKWRLDGVHGRLAGGAVGQAVEGLADRLASAWAALPAPDEVAIASVGDREVRQVLIEAVGRRFPDAAIREAVVAPVWDSVRIAYAEPERLGVDRFLALIGAHRRAPRDQLVVGIGTALTVDALAADGRHLGGLIAPGPALMQRSLVAATAGIRPAAAGAIVELAADTADAIASGAWHAAAGLVERMHRRAAAWACGPPALVVHGGDGASLAGLVDRPLELVPDLVIDGLAAWAEAT